MMEPIDLLWFLTVVGLINCEEGDVRLEVMAGNDVVLPCSLNNKDIGPAQFDWKKDGRQEVFLYDAGTHSNDRRQGQDEQFKGRVSHFPDELRHGNASISIRNTQLSDSGSYTCYFPHIQQQRFLIELLVVVSPRPITTLHERNDGVLLHCEVLGAFPQPVVEWWDSDGNILPADQPTITDRGGNKYDVILNAPVTKSDVYRCVSTQKDINHQIYTETFLPGPGDDMEKILGLMVGWCLGLLSFVLAAVLIYQSRRFGYIRRCLIKRRDSDMDFDSPLLSVVKLEVMAGSDVVLPCSFSTKNDIEPILFVWRKDGRQDVFLYKNGTHFNNGCPGQDEQFKGRVSHFPDELINGNASIIIRNTRLSDSGSYTCDFQHIQQRFHIELLVERCASDKDFDSPLLRKHAGNKGFDFSHRLGTLDSGMGSGSSYDTGTHDSGMGSGSSYDTEQPLNTEEKTQPGVAPVEPDEAVTVHLQESTE